MDRDKRKDERKTGKVYRRQQASKNAKKRKTEIYLRQKAGKITCKKLRIKDGMQGIGEERKKARMKDAMRVEERKKAGMKDAMQQIVEERKKQE